MLTTASPSLSFLLHSAAGTCCKTVHTRGYCIPATFCLCDLSNKVQRVKLSATCRRDKNVAKFVSHEPKFISTHEETCRSNMSLLHFFLGCVNIVILSLLHVPATRPCFMSPQCEQHMILSLLHVAATCPCGLSPRVLRPWPVWLVLVIGFIPTKLMYWSLLHVTDGWRKILNATS